MIPIIKPSYSIQEQLELLRNEKKLIIDDEDSFLLALKTIGFYKLKPYFRDFIQDDTFIKTITSSTIIDLYNFDFELSSLIGDKLAKIEILFRVLIEQLYNKGEELKYISIIDNPSFNKYNHGKNFKLFKKNAQKSFYLDYTNTPIYAGVQIFTFGELSKYFQLLDHEIFINNSGKQDTLQNLLAQKFHPKLQGNILRLWLEEIVKLRNAVAHHHKIIGMQVNLKKFIQPDLSISDVTSLGTLLGICDFILDKQNVKNQDYQSQITEILTDYLSLSIDIKKISIF